MTNGTKNLPSHVLTVFEWMSGEWGSGGRDEVAS